MSNTFSVRADVTDDDIAQAFSDDPELFACVLVSLAEYRKEQLDQVVRDTIDHLNKPARDLLKQLAWQAGCVDTENQVRP